jgi:hypothetical protein
LAEVPVQPGRRAARLSGALAAASSSLLVAERFDGI